MVPDFNKKQKRGFSKRNLYLIAGGILFLAVSALLIFADIKIYKEKQKLKTQLDVYKKQIKEIEDRNRALKEGIAEANNNDYVEKIAREELDLQKQGE
ncbi:MAG: septum formation initiator family protein, partial [Patescibacteria group bacterium]